MLPLAYCSCAQIHAMASGKKFPTLNTLLPVSTWVYSNSTLCSTTCYHTCCPSALSISSFIQERQLLVTFHLSRVFEYFLVTNRVPTTAELGRHFWHLYHRVPLIPCGSVFIYEWFNHLKTKHRLLYLTLRRLMSYIYGAPILDVSRSHTTTQHSR